MALSRVTTWVAGQTLTAAALNAEFDNILNNAASLFSPLTASLDLDGNVLVIDSDADSTLRATADDVVALRLLGFDAFIFDGDVSSPVNGLTLASAATGSGPTITAQGSDTNIPVTVAGKGTGAVLIGQATSTDVRLVADQPIADSSGNELIKFTKAASAVNEITVANAATGAEPSISATGGDTDIDLKLTPKGAGVVNVTAGGLTITAGPLNQAQGSDVASDATINLDTATGNLVDVTGTTTITAITLSQGRERTVRFTGALTLTHGASLVLPGSANIVTVAGDFATFRGYAAGVVRCVNYSKISLAPGSLGSDLGQCRLTKSGANLQLDRFNGSKLFINGAFESVPSAGVTLAPTSSTQDTTYYIYAYMSTGTMTLEYSTTAPTADTTYGHQIKTGDATRTLVGMARTITGPAWVDTDAQRYVLSHFNRRGIVGKSVLTASRTSSSASYAEINSEIRVEFITWADETVIASADGLVQHSATGSSIDTSISFDGTTAEETTSRFQAYTNNAQGGFGLCLPKTGLAVGYHYATLLGRTSGATATWTDGGGAGERCSLKIMVQG